MLKLIVIFRGQVNVSYYGFIDQILKIAGRATEIAHPQKLHITFTDSIPPSISIIPFRKKKISAISLYSEHGLSSPGNQDFLNFCRSDEKNHSVVFAGSYCVEEVLPVEYTKTWTDMEMTPGVCLLTLFRRKHGISHADFIHRWHKSHTPLSLQIHPLWHYNRNVVLEPATTGSELWEGIVEEHFRKRADLLNPARFFGNPITMVPNMIRVYKDTNSFLDYKTIETYLVREVIIK